MECFAGEHVPSKEVKWTFREGFVWSTVEGLAVFIWIFTFVNIFVFDFDVKVLGVANPTVEWILHWKAIAVLGLLTLSGVALGIWETILTISFIATYPLFVLCWRLPKLAIKRWRFVVASTPAIYRFFSSLKQIAVFYILFAWAVVGISLSTNSYVLGFCMVYLLMFLSSHLFRSIKIAYGKGVFATMADFIRSNRIKAISRFPNLPSDSDTSVQTRSEVLSLYLIRCVTETIDEKIQEVGKSRLHDIPLIGGWLYTIGLTIVVFGIEYFALYEIDKSAFTFTQGSSFQSFMALSLGMFTGAQLAGISPASTPAFILIYLQSVVKILIFVISVFTILRAARETHMEEMKTFGEELKITASIIDARLSKVFNTTLEEVEASFIESELTLVNYFRRNRGLPEFAPAPALVGEEKPTSST